MSCSDTFNAHVTILPELVYFGITFELLILIPDLVAIVSDIVCILGSVYVMGILQRYQLLRVSFTERRGARMEYRQQGKGGH